jgi:hypothetical protein
MGMDHVQIGRDYTLQTSLDLITWQKVQSFTPYAGTNQWTETSPKENAAFYRLLH